MASYFLKKLGQGADLTDSDRALLTSLSQSTQRFDARRDIVVEGQKPRWLPLILEGWACRYSMLQNGNRQMISLLLPGDLCEPFGMLSQFGGHTLAALTPVMIASVPVEALRSAAQNSKPIERALWWDLLFTTAVEREHIVSLGQRSASESLGHLFCELHLRLRMAGLIEGNQFELPLIQADLGDLLGLSTVHVNRSLQELRKSGLIALKRRWLTIYHVERLREFSFFDASHFPFDELAST